MDSVLTQLQREIDKMSKQKKQHISRQDNYSQSFFNASPVMMQNLTQGEANQFDQVFSSSQSISFNSPQTLRGREKQNSRNDNFRQSDSKNSQTRQHQQQQHSIHSHRSETSSQRAITPQQYNSRKDEVKEMFISKDELFKKANYKFKKLLSNRQQHLSNFKANNAMVLNYWVNKQKELQELIEEIKESQKQYQSIIMNHKDKLSEQQSQTNLSVTKQSKSQERKVWLSKNPKIGKKTSQDFLAIREESKSRFSSINSSQYQQQQQNQTNINNNSDSDCNVDEDEVIVEKQAQIIQTDYFIRDQQFQELSIQIATQNYNQINNYLSVLMQMSSQIQQLCQQQYSDQKQSDDQYLFDEVTQIFEYVQQIEERYFGTTMAWEKELRDLINKNKQKSHNIIELEKTISDITIKKNEIQFQYETLEREIELINKSLYIQYGISFSNYNSIDHTTKLDLENIKKVFEDNERLKKDFEKLLDNIESSRGDLQRISNNNRAAVQSVPTMITQQYKLAKDTYDQQIQQLTQQYDSKIVTLNNELSKSRQRVIDMIDDKQSMEKDIYQLKLEKKDLKNDLEMKTKRIQELEVALQETKYKSNHIVMQSESKSIAVNEVHTRNEILNESLDKLKTELLNQKRIFNQLESEHFDLEKENLRIKKDFKKLQVQNQSYQDEKEHLIQMLEMKNHLLAIDNTGNNNDQPKIVVGGNTVTQLDQFLAIQRLSMFVLNRSGQNGGGDSSSIDENTKNIVRSIFNENVCKLLDQYETKINQQKKTITELYNELNESQQLVTRFVDQNLQYIELLLEVSTEFQKIQIGEIPQEILMLNEKIMSMNPQFIDDKSQLKRQNEDNNNKLKHIFNRMEQLKHEYKDEQDHRQQKLSNQQSLELSDRNLLIAQQSPQKIRDQLFNEYQAKMQARVDDLKQQNENMQYKLDQLLSDNEDLNRQLSNLKKKDTDTTKLKSQIEQLKEIISKLQSQKQNTTALDSDRQLQQQQNTTGDIKDQTCYSDLKLVIQRLDSELKREKSQVEFLRQQLNDQSLFEGLDGFMEDDLLFNKSSEARTTTGGRMMMHGGGGGDHSVGRVVKRNKNKSSDIINVFDEPSPINSPFQQHNKAFKKANTKRENMKQQYELQITQFRKNIEDNKQMIELQCIVIEDLLEQRNKLQKDLNQSKSQNQSPDVVKLLKINSLQVNNNEYKDINENIQKSNSVSPDRKNNNNSSSLNRGESRIPRLSISRKQ